MLCDENSTTMLCFPEVPKSLFLSLLQLSARKFRAILFTFLVSQHFLHQLAFSFLIQVKILKHYPHIHIIDICIQILEIILLILIWFSFTQVLIIFQRMQKAYVLVRLLITIILPRKICHKNKLWKQQLLFKCWPLSLGLKKKLHNF